MIGETLGSNVETAFIRSLASDRYSVEGPTPEDLIRAAHLMATYEDLPLGATDATVVALAERRGDATIATLDRRHFGTVVSTLGPLTLLPELIAPSRR